jgi:hypothetical protein
VLEPLDFPHLRPSILIESVGSVRPNAFPIFFEQIEHREKNFTRVAIEDP